jgi:DNA-binding LacI/PurR family transcriptional regulator
VTRRTDSVALVVSESEERVFGEPFFAGIVRGISAELARTPAAVVAGDGAVPVGLMRLEHHLTEQHVDGVMLLSLHGAEPLPHAPASAGCRRCWAAARSTEVDPVWPVRFVDVDNPGGARAAVEYLIASGRRHIGHVAGPQDMAVGWAGWPATGRRWAGNRQAPLIVYGDFSEISGVAATRSLLEREPRMDALFVASDLMALGAMRALRQAGA